LNDLDKICTAIETVLAEGIGAAFNTNTKTTATCTRGLNQGLNRRLKKLELFKDLYEKPIWITVATTFDDVRVAPRQYGFVDVLEDLIVSEASQTRLQQQLQASLGASVENVNIGLVETENKPILVVSFRDPPTSSPSASPTATGGGGPTASKAYHFHSSAYLLSLVVAVGIVVLV